MKKQNFFIWYYSQGLGDFLETWKDFLYFIWRYFSVTDLIATLFSPWKRDVVFRNWRGWRPLKSAEILIENFFSRFIGFLVRLSVIFLGLAIIFAALLTGIILLFIWVALPFLLLVIAATGIAGSLTAQLGMIAMLLFIAFICLIYRDSRKIPYIQMDIKELRREKCFERIYHRMEITKRGADDDIFNNPESLKSFLKNLDLDDEDFQSIISWEAGFQQRKEDKSKFWKKENLEKIPPLGKQWKYAYTPHLDEYTVDLSRLDPTEYRDIDLIGRQDEMEVIKLVLNRPVQNSVLLVGDSGIGKKTLVHHLAKLIRHNQAEKQLEDTRLLLFDMGRMISDVLSKGGDVDNVLHAMFQEAAYAGNVVLIIEHFENYLGKDSSVFHPDISAVMSKYLELPTFQVIATSSQKEYHDLIEQHEQLMKYFEVVEMKEPTEQDTLKILLQNLEKFEEKRVIFSYGALKHAIAVSDKYHWEVPLPERPLDVAMEVMMYWQKNPQTAFIIPETVDSFLTLKTGMPQGEIGEEEKGKLLQLEEILHRRVIGQEEAVRQVAEALRRARTGIGNSERPIGSFLFLGPTGVGKTETAKALAEAYYGDEEKMIRLDMSEFQTPSSLDQLIGSSNLNKPGRLINKVKDSPFSLLLLDEIEKAYPDVLDIFLQILDEGFVTDAFGEKISFRNMIIIATSNAGAPLIKQMVEQEKDPEIIKENVIDYVVNNSIFRVEFLNRFDDVIFFCPLEGNELRSVVKLMMGRFARQLQKEKNIEILFDDKVIDQIIDSGYDPVFGARSLNRYVEDKIEDMLAKKIIAGEVKKGEKLKISSEDVSFNPPNIEN